MTEKLRIALVNQGGRGWMGGEIYIANIVKALASLPADERKGIEVSLLLESPGSDLAQLVDSHDFVSCHELSQVLPPTTPTKRLGWKLQKMLLRKADPRFERFVQMQGLDFVYPYFAPREKVFTARSCTWIPDFQHRFLPHLFSDAEVRSRDRSHAELAAHSERIVFSSQAVATDFRTFYPASKAKAEILHFRTSPSPDWLASDAAAVRRKYVLPDRYLLLCGQFWQHKNHMVVLEALQLLREQGVYPVIVCTGHLYDYRKPEHCDVILQAIHTRGLAQQFLVLGLIPRLDQIQLMRDCIGVVQPSLFEGWSTVVEDARCLGRPLILSDLAVHMEQNPPGAAYFERSNAADLAARLAEWWAQAQPDADRSLERQAQVANREDIQAFARQFLAIARRH